jgi:hypothetical protein
VLISTSIGAKTVDAQWIQKNIGTDELFTYMVMLDTAIAIAVGLNRSILRTSDAGTTWINVAAPLSFVVPWNGISFYDAANGIVVGDHGVVGTTSNGGENWIWHQVQGRQNCLSTLYAGPGRIYVGADSGWVYYTSDTGRTWTTEKISAWRISSLFMYRRPTAMGAPINALTPYSLCTRGLNPPFSWRESILTSFQYEGSAAYDADFCNGGGVGFIVGIQGDARAQPMVIRKSMSDTAWSWAITGIVRDGTLFGVSVPSENVIYVCGGDRHRGSRESPAVEIYARTELPQPFNPTTTLPSRSFVSLKVSCQKHYLREIILDDGILQTHQVASISTAYPPCLRHGEISFQPTAGMDNLAHYPRRRKCFCSNDNIEIKDLKRSFVLVDDTVIVKPYSKKHEILSYLPVKILLELNLCIYLSSFYQRSVLYGDIGKSCEDD